MEEGTAVASTCLHVSRRRLQTKLQISRKGVPGSGALYTHRSQIQKAIGLEYGSRTIEGWKGSKTPGSAPGFELAAACLALSHLRAQRGSAGRARTSQAAPGRSGRSPSARRCPRLPGLRVLAAALTRRSSRALSTRRAIAPSPPPRPTLRTPVPFHAVPSAKSPGARIRLLPRVPASPCGARAARPRGTVPGVAATGRWRWGICGERRRLVTPALCRIRTWDRDVPGWGL